MGSWQIKLYYHMHSFRINHVRILWTVWFTIPCKWTPDAITNIITRRVELRIASYS